MNDLRRIRGMKPQALRQSGQSILEHVAEGKATQPEDYPERPAGPLPKKVQPCVEAIKVFCRKRARELGLLPELVPPKPWTGPPAAQLAGQRHLYPPAEGRRLANGSGAYPLAGTSQPAELRTPSVEEVPY